MSKYLKYPHPCSVRNCKRKVGRAEKSDKCSKHRRDQHRLDHPLAYYWGKLKRRARERGVPFHLTLAEYSEFAIKTDYHKLRGKTSMSLTVDRIDSSLPYIKWNVQALTLRANARKEYVNFFNGGMMPEKKAAEIRALDRAYRDECWKLAQEIGEVHGYGTEKFWKLFHHMKRNLFESVTT